MPQQTIEKQDLKNMFETKLTRAEVLDLILEDMATELQSQIDKKQKEIDAVLPSDDDEFLSLLPKKPKVKVERDWDNKNNLYVTFGFTLPKSRLPPDYVRRSSSLEKLRGELNDLTERRKELLNNKVKFKNELIRSQLDASAEGREILELLGKFKLSIQKKMLKVG